MRTLLFSTVFLLLFNAYGQFDYSDTASWFIHEEERDLEIDERADLFFVHPTTYYRGRPKNELKIRPTTKKRLDIVERNQCEAFRHECRIFMPHYRQASLGVFFDRDTSSLHETIDLAYSDVRAAFIYYMEHWNNGRPIVIASHSQGSYHAIRMLKEFLDTGVYSEQLIVAYVVGMPMSEEQMAEFDSIEYCSSSGQTGCLTSWMTVDIRGQREPGQRRNVLIADEVVPVRGLNFLCTNPLNWSPQEYIQTVGKAERALYLTMSEEILRFNRRPLEGTVSGAFVRIDGHDRGAFNGTFGNLHIYDYNLFFRDIQMNVTERIDRYLDALED